MYYIEYYHKSAISEELIPALGDRSVFILDGRNSTETMHIDAVVNNGVRRPLYDAYQLMQGQSFTRSSPISDIIAL